MAAAVDSFELLYGELARTCSGYVETLALVGALYTVSRAAVLLARCYRLARVHFFPRMTAGSKLAQRYGPWAVVYGASESLANAYAMELAKQGVSIVFVTQDGASVCDAAAALSQSYGVETLVVVADVTQGPAASKPVVDALKGKDVGFLVNCVDESSARDETSLLEMSERALLDAVNKNVLAATLMTRLVLPVMVERSKGAVVNISPGVCCRPLPGRVALTASAGYLDHFSSALHLEYGCKGIFVQSLMPFQVASSDESLSSLEGWLVPKPEVYARHAISTLGVSNRTTGYWPHTLQYGLMMCIPEWIWVLGSRALLASR